ncbi:hypothetical protein Ddye_009581 [Dipteronia dyeriana]|uniref:Uncharacterized protein n=1 Tax=Dipteronia dyeriana TaxID=168575 RepID=A0AAE0CMH5_9ROSI|nr:hypothetical protein Ddye_009581 [Dipteronia dyeriana]
MNSPMKSFLSPPQAQQHQHIRRNNNRNHNIRKSEKLLDLLNLVDSSKSKAATKKKEEEALEELKRVVRELQVKDEDDIDRGRGDI